MKAPFSHVSHGTPEAYREFIAESAGLDRIQAELAEAYAAIGDDVGLEYATHRLVAYTRCVISTLADLKRAKTGEHA